MDAAPLNVDAAAGSFDDGRVYANGLARLKAKFRDVLQAVLRDMTGNRRATMRWTTKGYAFVIVYRNGVKLVGWPVYAGIPFANLSHIRGGQPIIRFLLELWNAGILRFERASAEEIELAKRNPKAVLPGAPRQLSAPFCWGPFGTNSIGKTRTGRYRKRENALTIPIRRVRTGPKTPKLVLEDEGEEDMEVRSDGE